MHTLKKNDVPTKPHTIDVQQERLLASASQKWSIVLSLIDTRRSGIKFHTFSIALHSLVIIINHSTFQCVAGFLMLIFRIWGVVGYLIITARNLLLSGGERILIIDQQSYGQKYSHTFSRIQFVELGHEKGKCMLDIQVLSTRE